MKQIHATQLTQFWKCPYKYKYDDTGFDPRYTYLGDIIHKASEGIDQKKLEPIVEYYCQNLDNDFKIRQTIYELMDIVYKWYQKYKDYILWQEMKLLLSYDDLLINSTPDVVLKKDDYVKVLDFKTSKSFYMYDQTDIREENLQPEVYSYQVMQYLGIDEVVFSFFVLSKSNRSSKEYKKKMKKKDVEKRLKKIIDELKYSEEYDIWKAKKNSLCFACPFNNYNGDKTCPLYKKEKVEEDDDLGF